MPALLTLALTLQIRVGVEATPPVRQDTSVKREVSVGVRVGNDGRRPATRIPVTAEHLRTAYKSAAARTMVERARAMRMAQDSALMSYDATTYLRVSAGMGFSKIGRDRLIFRHENATQVKWHRNTGAWIEVKGARTVIPIAPEEAQKEAAADMDSDMNPIPYYPGQEPMLKFFGGENVEARVNDRDVVHPLAEGAEAYYTYEAGDSVSFKLPDGTIVQLREINVRPRVSKWNVVVGALWFDVRTGQLVRAAYRLAVPMDVWAKVAEEDSTAQDDIPVWVKPLISPMSAQISAIAVEYGLYEGRFWLPRRHSAEGDARVSFMRVPFKMEQSFKYASVNAIDSLPPIKVTIRPQPPDSLEGKELRAWRDSARAVRRAQREAVADSVRQGLKIEVPRCDSTNSRTIMEHRRSANLNVATHVTCDISKLANSPDLPKSIYDEGEEVSGSAERDALIKEALSMTAQPPFAFGAVPPQIKYGLEFTRYNRVEGLSSAIRVEQVLGGGYTASAQGRLGLADFVPNFELGVSRSNLRRAISGRVYSRLAAANDWGSPLSFGSSMSALLFGRDEGFYYRTAGAELELARERGNPLTWRFFAERERAASVSTLFTLGAAFRPNITTQTRNYAGASMRFIHTRGLDPNGFRMFTDVRVEGATSDTAGGAFGRGALDLTFTQSIGKVATALTLAGGTSVGNVPNQRLWYLGGTQTVRGQRADTANAGNAFWLGRLELGRTLQGVRPVVFGDIGWVGDRTQVKQVGRPMSGAGVGVSMFDGLVRADLSHGLFPRRGNRLDLYLEARF
ncbi:MAG: ShlB/FhaC/HecB family hemolysin secretion/activation protein [Gemmatimonadota bacterium]